MTIIEAHQEKIEQPDLNIFEYFRGFAIVILFGIAISGLGLAFGMVIFYALSNEPMQPSWNYYLANDPLNKEQVTLSGGVKIDGALK